VIVKKEIRRPLNEPSECILIHAELNKKETNAFKGMHPVLT
jgi:hypothetical protein